MLIDSTGTGLRSHTAFQRSYMSVDWLVCRIPQAEVSIKKRHSIRLFSVKPIVPKVCCQVTDSRFCIELSLSVMCICVLQATLVK